jgi:hypothetical protein
MARPTRRPSPRGRTPCGCWTGGRNWRVRTASHGARWRLSSYWLGKRLGYPNGLFDGFGAGVLNIGSLLNEPLPLEGASKNAVPA